MRQLCGGNFVFGEEALGAFGEVAEKVTAVVIVDEEACAWGVGRRGGDDLDVATHGAELGFCRRWRGFLPFWSRRSKDKTRSVNLIRVELERNAAAKEVLGDLGVLQKAVILPLLKGSLRREETVFGEEVSVAKEFSSDCLRDRVWDLGLGRPIFTRRLDGEASSGLRWAKISGRSGSIIRDRVWDPTYS